MDIAGKRIMVTGGAGFLGSRVCQLLQDGGVSEIIVPRSRTHDLTRQDVVDSYVAESRPDAILHLAAEVGGIGANRANPGRYFYANMAMGLFLIEAARQHGVEKFVQVGTVCAYPKFTPVPFREETLWDGYPEETNAPYGVAKRSLLVMLQAYRQQYGLNGVYLLPANLYGPGDNFDLETSHVIPALIRKFADATDADRPSVTVWGTGTPSREFLYVDDAAGAILKALLCYDDPDPINVGTGVETTVRELVEAIADVTGFRGEIVWDSSKPDGQPRRQLDIERARRNLGFAPQITLQEGLRLTVDWWRNSNMARLSE